MQQIQTLMTPIVGKKVEQWEPLFIGGKNAK
jgi:hypothetical protein